MYIFSAIAGIQDIVFAIDSSSPDSLLRQMKLFVKESSRPFDFSSRASRVALIEYNSEVKPRLGLSSTTQSKFSSEVDKIQAQEGSSDLKKVIKYIQDDMFPRSSPSRPGAVRMVVLLMNGDLPASEIKPLKEQLRAMKAADIRYVIVNVGSTTGNGRLLKSLGNRYGEVILIEEAENVPEATPVVLKSAAAVKGMSFLESRPQVTLTMLVCRNVL